MRLLRLASPDDPKRADRAALATLRGVLRDTPADYYRAAKYVVPYLGERASSSDRWFYLVGGLLALHPQHSHGIGFGQAFGTLRDESGSMDARMLALLNTPADALPRVLRQLFGLLEAKGQPVDYLRLLRELGSWDDPTHWVQKRWAREYFRQGKAGEDAPGSNSTETV